MNGKTLLHYTYGICIAILLFALATSLAMGAKAPFQMEEAGIDDLRQVTKDGRTVCRPLVQSYIDRTQAYNGTCTKLVTKNGATIKTTSIYESATQHRAPPPAFGPLVRH